MALMENLVLDGRYLTTNRLPVLMKPRSRKHDQLAIDTRELVYDVVQYVSVVVMWSQSRKWDKEETWKQLL